MTTPSTLSTPQVSTDAWGFRLTEIILRAIFLY